MDDIARSMQREIEAAKRLLASLRVFVGADDEQAVADTFEGETTLDAAIDRALRELEEAEILLAGIKQRNAELCVRAERIDKHAETVRGLIEMAMREAEWKTKRFPTATLTVSPSKPAVIVDDEAAVPSVFFKRADPKLSKSDLNAVVVDLHKRLTDATAERDPAVRVEKMLDVLRDPNVPDNPERTAALGALRGINDPVEYADAIAKIIGRYPLIPGVHLETGRTQLTIRKK